MAAPKTLYIFLIYCIYIQFVFSLPYMNTCEDQLLSYRKFILTAVLNFEDICDTTAYDQQDRNGFSIIGSNVGMGGNSNLRVDDIRNRPEVWAFFRMLMAQFKDNEFINILKDAIIEKCKEKSQNDKRDGVVIGKKQRFHSWGGKRANNFQQDNLGSSSSASSLLYSNAAGLHRNVIGAGAGGGGSNSEATKFGWNN